MAFKLMTRGVIPLVIVLAAAGIARSLFLLAPAAARNKPPPRTTIVEIVQVQPTKATAKVQATGVVVPALEVVVVPEVTGKVSYVSKSLIPGGRFEKGELLLRISAGDYRALVDQERSRVDRAELELKVEKGRQRIAKREWNIIGQGADEMEKELGLRKPHLETAKGELDAARAGLHRARLSLGRTTIRAPFNGTVLEEAVDRGQVVGPSSRLATLVGTDRFWVRVSVPVEQLADLYVPGVNAEQGSEAKLTQRLGADRTMTREGRVSRLITRLEAQTRTAQVIVAVDDPMDSPDGELPLLPGAYVDVEMAGRDLDAVFVVPRAAVHEGERVWVVGPGEKLLSRKIRVRWSGPQDLSVTGLQKGDRVVTSPLALPIEGMQVRVRENGQAAPVQSGTSPARDG